MRRWATTVVSILLAAGALALVWRSLQQFSMSQVVDSLHHLTGPNLVLTALFTAGSYLCLTGFDYLGVRYAGHRLPWRTVALTSFVSLSIGHTVGLAPLSSGAVRYRFYSQLGLDAATVARVIAFSALAVTAGELSVASIALIAHPGLAARILALDPAAARWLGGGGLALLAAYLVVAALVRGSLRIWRFSFAMPSWKLALGQIAIGTANYAMVAAALTFAIGPAGHIDYASVTTAYILANLAALISHVPGGLGVIEAVIVMVFPGSAVIGGLLAFRAIYFLVPFAIGSLTFIGFEARAWLRRRGAAPASPATGTAR